MKDFNNRLNRLEEKIILSGRAEIDYEDFSKLLKVISDNDLHILSNSSGETLTRNTKEMLQKYKLEVNSYQLSRFEKLERTFIDNALSQLSKDKMEEIKKKTEKGRAIINEILDRWEEKLKILEVS